MKKIFILLLIFTWCISIPATSSALTRQASGLKPPPMSTADDGYRPDSDPLPEWLFLPEGTNENALTFSGSQSGTLTIKESGSDRWKIVTERNGARITYTRYENGKLQFVIKTNKNYTKMAVYTENSKGKLKLNKSISPEDYFDPNTPISISPIQEKQSRFAFFAHASATASTSRSCAVHPDLCPQPKQVPAQLTKRQLNKLNHKVGFRGSDAVVANKVSYYESGGGKTQVVACEDGSGAGFNPPSGYVGKRAVSYCLEHGKGAGRGLYQLSTQWTKDCTNNCAFSPEKNAKYAYKMRKKGGWDQWCSYGGCPGGPPAGQGPAMKQ